METRADIPPDLTDEDKAFLFQTLDVELNSGIFYALLYGVYTGILAVTLWNIFINKIRPVRRTLVVIIILLHALITINFAADWSCTRSAFIENGQSFWTVYLNLNVTEASYWEMDIPALMSTILTDSYICCWVVWGRRWLIVLLPIICLITATVSKVLQVYLVNSNAYMLYEVFLMLYISFVLATTLWCTLLIIFRILTVTGVGRGTGGRLSVYRRFIGVLVESSAFYSIVLILYLALFIRNDFGFYYLDAIASIAKGVAPMLLVGRAAAGQRAQPKNMMKLRWCLPFVSRRLRNLLTLRNLLLQAIRNPLCRAQSLKWTLKLNWSSRMSSPYPL
ncbi:uncharacterized protein EV420DRAFT_1645202 [Desarmillaria tabescens]|uniref:Uncharacterized protein n=1 Tax=Armillaria tabescens TaxID=1929756 RepID=A0AA39K441_ARMTA|nr:uncharacterized protein EV420DRAFT_1645202 [Desarmillaria tabescens]KAK0453983.1 hypothetical protein EV420DRAFT_1645202 [Desarmillaria tabescens]